MADSEWDPGILFTGDGDLIDKESPGKFKQGRSRILLGNFTKWRSRLRFYDLLGIERVMGHSSGQGSSFLASPLLDFLCDCLQGFRESRNRTIGDLDDFLLIDWQFKIKSFGFNTTDLRSFRKAIALNVGYLTVLGASVRITIFFSQNHTSSYSFVVWLNFWVVATMTQGSFVAKQGEGKDNGITRKRLKVSVPHFDNSDLIRSYDKTVVGRCMNPKEQDVKALLVMLPKIWKLEDKVVGMDLGLGRFQFHFDKEEDIVTVLEQQPYHFG